MLATLALGLDVRKSNCHSQRLCIKPVGAERRRREVEEEEKKGEKQIFVFSALYLSI